MVEFFWSGQHWLKASVLYLPLQEGGQGLVDIRSRVRAFRLQTAQRLLYGEEVSWAGVACVLLRRAGSMGFGHFVSEDWWNSAENLASKLGMSSIRVAERLLTQITEFFPPDYRLSLATCDGEVESSVFLELNFAADMRLWLDMDNGLFLLRHLSWGFLAMLERKLFMHCVWRCPIFFIFRAWGSLNGKRLLA